METYEKTVVFFSFLAMLREDCISLPSTILQEIQDCPWLLTLCQARVLTFLFWVRHGQTIGCARGLTSECMAVVVFFEHLAFWFGKHHFPKLSLFEVWDLESFGFDKQFPQIWWTPFPPCEVWNPLEAPRARRFPNFPRILKWIDMTFPGPSLAVPEDT